jgi:hypothetical protein
MTSDFLRKNKNVSYKVENRVYIYVLIFAFLGMGQLKILTWLEASILNLTSSELIKITNSASFQNAPHTSL